MPESPHGSHQIEMIIEGSRVPPGAVDLDTLAPLANGLLRAFRAVARQRRGQPASKAGQPSKDIREATGLRLVGIRQGSTVLVWESAEVDLFGGRADETIEDFINLIASEAGVEPAIADPLEEAWRSLGDRGRITLSLGRSKVIVDEQRIARLRREPPTVDERRELVVSGWLHAADLDPDEIRIRDATNIEWTCRYSADLEPSVRAALGEVVRAWGTGRQTGRRGDLDVDGLEVISTPVGVRATTTGLSREEALRAATGAQGITGPQPLEVLRTDADPDDPEEIAFAEALEAFG